MHTLSPLSPDWCSPTTRMWRRCSRGAWARTRPKSGPRTVLFPEAILSDLVFCHRPSGGGAETATAGCRALSMWTSQGTKALSLSAGGGGLHAPTAGGCWPGVAPRYTSYMPSTSTYTWPSSSIFKSLRISDAFVREAVLLSSPQSLALSWLLGWWPAFLYFNAISPILWAAVLRILSGVVLVVE
ncbi:hypothetical protein DFH27DRAFT_583505 [Peziza echinospora]|nr:hypothetical protein DFH27DRAFT_583505 [Peziza echinospora]